MSVNPLTSNPGTMLADIAERVARAAYYDALARGATDASALAAATQAWRQKYEQASLLGYTDVNGEIRSTLGATEAAGFFGGNDPLRPNAPTTAEQQITGWYVDPVSGQRTPILRSYEDVGNIPGLGPTLAKTAQEEARREFDVTSSGYYGSQANQLPTLARESEQNRTLLGLGNIAAGLRGPENYLQYARVLGGTPGGLRDIADAAAGRFRMPAAGPQIQPGGGLDVAGGSTSSAAGGQPAQIRDTGGIRPVQQAEPSGLAPASLSGLFADIHDPSRSQPPTTNLASPYQIDPIAWSRFSPTQQKLNIADYESQGWNPQDVNYYRQRSLPGYGGAQRGGVGLFG